MPETNIQLPLFPDHPELYDNKTLTAIQTSSLPHVFDLGVPPAYPSSGTEEAATTYRHAQTLCKGLSPRTNIM